jgi:sporulation protein YlmC with PRC-barrel domain
LVWKFGGWLISVEELNGRNVITSDACTLGDIAGAQVNTATWQITDLTVSLTEESAQELGMKKPRFGSVKVCLPITLIQAVGDVITLNKPLQELKTLEECE